MTLGKTLVLSASGAVMLAVLLPTAASIGDETSDKATAAYQAGAALLEKGEFDKAILQFSQAIGFRPRFAGAYSGRGTAYWSMGDMDKAIADYTLALAINDKLAETWFNRGVAYADKGEPDKAIADFDRAITLSPKDANL